MFSLRSARLGPITLTLLLTTGCAAVTNPLVDSLPVHHVPPELLQCPRDKMDSVPLSLLQQPPAAPYRIDAGDVLGVWIEGVIGERNTPIPVYTSAASTFPGQSQRFPPPSAGYPFPVAEDGAVRLPLLKTPLTVRGLSLTEIEALVRKAYTDAELLPPGRERLFVTLMQRRRVEIVVLRQEATAFGVGPEGAFASAGKRGSGLILELAAGENDVLHALAQSGGLPGLDAFNEVVIYRRPPSTAAVGDAKQVVEDFQTRGPDGLPAAGPVVRIPLRWEPGQPVPFRPQDIILQRGDVVYVEAREKEVYYTAGLLPAGEHVLPRDRDLDVLAAVALVRGPLVNSTYGTNNLSGTIFPPGLGNPSASLLVVLRKTSSGGQVPIRVDLNMALRDARERILVRPGDVLVLQERPTEALTRYGAATLANFNLIWAPIHSRYATGVVDIMAPDRLPGRGLYSTFSPTSVSTNNVGIGR